MQPIFSEESLIKIAKGFFVVSLLVVAIYYVKTNPPFSTTAYSVCYAGDLPAFKKCLSDLSRSRTDNIEVTSLITCSGRTTNACKFNLSKITRPVSIYGKPNTGAGFRRVDTYEHKIFSIAGSNGVTIKNLIFDETESVGSCGNLCDSPIGISDSSNIILEDVTIADSKNMGIEVSKTQNLTVKNSRIINSAVFGIWMHNDPHYVSSNVRIENNLFKDNKSNAILFSATAPTDKPSNITGNTFIHNHRDAVFFVCGQNKTSPCPGGQLLIERETNNLLISNNVIKDGRIDAYEAQGLRASGIEFGLQNISNVTVSHNDIHNNTGAGIVENPGSQVLTNILLTGNKLYSNGQNIVMSQFQAVNNCTTPTCFLLTSGKIYADPNPCVLASASTVCASSIVWSTNDASNVSVKVGTGALFSTNPSTSQSAPWIGSTGATFNLYSGEVLLDSVFVNGK